MDYQFENLGPERFQQFCQALLINEFPNVQCFPVAQPDGGRDAITYHLQKQPGEFVVFQAKFVRKPLAETDVHKWLINIMVDEAPKLKTLIPKGAKAYYLITNVPGTAHSGVGSIDKMQAILRGALTVPAYCWWRDDLGRRLDTAWNLKWAYPELMTGIDMLRHIIESRLSEDQERRTNAVRAYIRSQYNEEREVRFKQVDLQNQLLDLFIDVPLEIRHLQTEEKQRSQDYYLIQAIARSTRAVFETTEGRRYHHDEEEFLGTAAMLLHPLSQNHLSQVVLEGAPGQGKSTIAQYVCQIHRMKILGEEQMLGKVPAHHKDTPMRIPFKVELRDLATWLNRQDPFSSETDQNLPDDWHKSLESFLVAQIRHYSGGFEFRVADLHAVAKVSEILLVLDGLDEVADISTRRDVVKEAIAGINRLRDSTKALQIIITSRPAAFANSPGFPEDEFLHLELGSVTRVLIDEYADKWLRARSIFGRHRAEIKAILQEKLAQEHLRELARNPMQLAILLSLIHTRGASLPEKRTALYDNYVDLFFNREAEKSDIVREYRDLLIDIHRYLGWHLHSEAEKGNDRGSISSERLQRLLEEYLASEGRDPSLAGKLFTGMVERVVALVSRVEGTYEFEVQPLREYFAARHLYETAPYSPPGGEKSGTKPDRFDALARNFYWLNVTRFYAGCYSKGELPSLVDRLCELAEEDGYRYTSHPRSLAATFLSDWVFAQHPKSMETAVKIVLDGLGLRYALSLGTRYKRSTNQLVLPRDCGRERLIQRCFDILETYPPYDYARELIALININSEGENIEDMWYARAQRATGSERTRWLLHGLHLEVLPRIDSSKMESLLEDDPHNGTRLGALLHAGYVAFCEQSDERCQTLIDAILDGQVALSFQQSVSSILEWFALALEPLQFSIAFRFPQPIPLSQVMSRYYPFQAFERRFDQMLSIPSDESQRKCMELIDIVKKEVSRTAREWASELTPWDNVVETSRALFGERWATFCLANIASGIKSRDETCTDSPNLLDHSTSLCRRVRYARLRSGNAKWWMAQLNEAKDSVDLTLISLVLLTWGSPGTLARLAERLGEILATLSEYDWQRVAHSLRSTVRSVHENQLKRIAVGGLPASLSERFIAAIALRVDEHTALDLYQRHLHDYQGDDLFVLEFCQSSSFQLLELGPSDWQRHLAIIKRSYAQGVVAEYYPWSLFGTSGEQDWLPLAVAEKIAEDAERYPHYLVNLAEAKCRQAVTERVIPVGEIARREGWFGG